jgi:replicative DNA helicase
MNTREFAVVAWMLKRPDLLTFQGDKIRKIHMTYPSARLILAAIWEAIDKFDAPPGLSEIASWAAEFGEKRGWAAIQVAQAIVDLDYVRDLDVTEVTGQQVLDEITLAEASRIGKSLMAGSAEDIRKSLDRYQNDLDEIKSLQRKSDQDGIGVYPYQDVRTKLELLQETYTQKALSFGIPRLDSKFLGGARPQEVTLFQAGTNVGKTSIALNLTKHWALDCDAPGVMFAIDNDQIDLLERSFALVTRTPITGNIGDLEDYERRINARVGNRQDNLLYRIWDPDDRTMADVLIYLKKVQRMWALVGKQIRWVLIDYIDALVAEVAYRDKELRHGLKSLVNGAKRLARLFDCPVYLTTHGNREGMKAGEPGMDHMAESIGKAFSSNHVIIAHQSEVQEAMDADPIKGQHMDFIVAKARRPEKRYIVPCWFNPWTQVIQDGDPDMPIRRLKRRQLGGKKDGQQQAQQKDARPNQVGPAVRAQNLGVQATAHYQPDPPKENGTSVVVRPAPVIPPGGMTAVFQG